MDEQQVVVYCANGFQGHAIVTALLEAGCRVRALIRDDSRAQPLAAAGAEIYRADLNDPSTLTRSHDAADVAVVLLPSGISPDATRTQAANALSAIRQSGVNEIVLNSSVHFPTRSGELPQFEARREVEHTFLDGGFEISVIHAPFLLSNLLLPWARHSIASTGVLAYPVSPDIPLVWAAPEDVGRMVAIVVTQDLYGVRLHVGTRAAIQGHELASAFSPALGRTIQYAHLPLDDFEAGVDAAIGPGAGREIGAIFRFIDRYPDDRSFVSAPFWVPPGFPAFEPTTVEEWVGQHAASFENAVQTSP
jgi:NAD(P)H dehydrogenase (quinone)